MYSPTPEHRNIAVFSPESAKTTLPVLVMHSLRVVIWLTCCLLLQACLFTNQQQIVEPGIDTGTLSASQLKTWTLRGKLSLETEAGRNATGFIWQQNENNFEIQFSGFMGVGSACLYGDNTLATLESSNRELPITGTPAELSLILFGQLLPFDNLPWWIRGIPNPSLGYQALPASSPHDSSAFAQQEWQLQYSRFENYHNLQLPGRIDARSADIHVRIIIKSWDIPLQQVAP